MKPGTSYESVLKTAIPATQMEITQNYLIKGCLMGPSGSGKTQSSITLPLSADKPILLIDYDGRAETVAGEEHVEVIKLYDTDPDSPKAWDRGEDLRNELWVLARSGDFPYSGVIEDALTMMATVAMNSALTLTGKDGTLKRGLGGAPAKQHYMPQIQYIKKHINSMRNLPCHYVLNCHFDLLPMDEGNELKIVPKITKSLRTEVPSWFNEVYFCYREEGQPGKINYFWNTTGTGSHEYFKSTLNNKQRFWEGDIQVDFDKTPVGFGKLLSLRFPEKGGKEKAKGD